MENKYYLFWKKYLLIYLLPTYVICFFKVISFFHNAWGHLKIERKSYKLGKHIIPTSESDGGWSFVNRQLNINAFLKIEIAFRSLYFRFRTGALCFPRALKPWYNEPQYSEFHTIVNKTQLPFWGFTKHITFDIVNYLI